MKILITGANGYIGSKFVQYLCHNTEHIVVGLARSANTFSHKNYTHIVADLSDPAFLNTLTGEQVDFLFHLAQSSLYRIFPDGAPDMFNINTQSTAILLEWARKNSVKKFIYASTGNVYKPSNEVLSETAPCDPASYYGASKFAAEQFIKQYQNIFEVYICRIFGVYGPDQRNMIVPNMVNKVIANEEITLAKGKGLVYTPLYIEDCCEMLNCLINAKGNNVIYNFSGSEIVSLKTLIANIETCIGKKALIKETENNETYLTGSNKLFMSEFSYSPKTNLNTGINNLIKHV